MNSQGFSLLSTNQLHRSVSQNPSKSKGRIIKQHELCLVTCLLVLICLVLQYGGLYYTSFLESSTERIGPSLVESENSMLSKLIQSKSTRSSNKTSVVTTNSTQKQFSFYRLALVRAIGNSLPPRHDANQTLNNLEFILKHEPEFPKLVHKHWILNRIVDPALLKQLIELLHQYHQQHSYTIIPFHLQEYHTKYHYQYYDDSIHRSYFVKNGTSNKKYRSYIDYVQNDKNLYVTNQNMARNVAIDVGKHLTWYNNGRNRSTDYILPWDGNCFLSQAAHDILQRELKYWNRLYTKQRQSLLDTSLDESASTRGNTSSRIIRYFYTPMDRLKNANEQILDPSYQPILKSEEPQVILHRTAKGRFDPKLRYGRKNKVDFLQKMRLPGPWNFWSRPLPKAFPDVQKWPKHMSTPNVDVAVSVTKYTNTTTNRSIVPKAGWVSRLFSGKADLENANKFWHRGKARTDGMTQLLNNLDIKVAEQLYQWDVSTLMFYDIDVLSHESKMWRNQSMPDQTSRSAFQRLVQDLLRHADFSLNMGPWSVMDKSECGCGESGDCHDYLNVKSHIEKNTIDSGLLLVNTTNTTNNSSIPCDNDDVRYDRRRLEALQFHTTILALAYTMTNDLRYAEKAANNIVTWFVMPEKKMNPHLKGAFVTYKGKISGIYSRKNGPFEFKDVSFFLDAVRIIEDSGALSAEDKRSLRAWFRSYLEWLLSMGRGDDGAYYESTTYHGIFYDIQVIAIAAYVGDQSLAIQTLYDSISRLSSLFYNSGKVITESNSLSCENKLILKLQGWSILSRMASKVGIDMWKQLQGGSRMQLAYPEPNLCRALGDGNPLLRHRYFCNVTTVSQREDFTRWWPLYQDAQIHCPNLIVADFHTARGVWTKEGKISPPANHYDMKALYSEQIGIPPYWNMGYMRS